ncbi:diphthine--ammonia ligase-like [Argiope bruennichi]|uniref:Diphthine--ammonia ligase n=1 Tax=Argiope bruennichi TaxID=94029 RepID=A0A8T0ELM8_ARGBR|nr:diphthine--ammonia ligase-like [Argiope bruennichi]KAF8773606.1 Diphthine--ammonia ligase like protein [Argiope bruennichi]
MKVVALISGGKDSCYNMMQCAAQGHEIVALANLKPKEDEMDSYMYQSVGHNAVEYYASAMDLPMFQQSIEGKPINQDFGYQPTEGDEVEDLYKLLKKVKDSVEVQGVSVGAIFSDYQRLRVENVCERLGLQVLAYLWHRDQDELLQEMIDNKIHAIIIKVAALGLDPKIHLGMTLEEIQPHMRAMHQKFGLNICGEGGEFETFTLNCPLFKKKLIVLEKEIVIHSNDAFAPVGYLILKKIALSDKNME